MLRHSDVMYLFNYVHTCIIVPLTCTYTNTEGKNCCKCMVYLFMLGQQPAMCTKMVNHADPRMTKKRKAATSHERTSLAACENTAVSVWTPFVVCQHYLQHVRINYVKIKTWQQDRHAWLWCDGVASKNTNQQTSEWFVRIIDRVSVCVKVNY